MELALGTSLLLAPLMLGTGAVTELLAGLLGVGGGTLRRDRSAT